MLETVGASSGPAWRMETVMASGTLVTESGPDKQKSAQGQGHWQAIYFLCRMTGVRQDYTGQNYESRHIC
jgi:hypothetical protein